MADTLNALLAALLAPFATWRGTATVLFSGIGLALVAAGSFARNMVPLRALTVASQVAFVAAACVAPNVVAIAAYLLLIPLNTWRLLEIVRLTRRVEAASTRDRLSGLWLKPYMRSRRLAPGTVLFRAGDSADELYWLVAGELRFEEIGELQPVGEMFGEIAFFSPRRTRSLTAVCVSECEVMGIQEAAFKQLYYQSPELAFRVSNLIAERLSADIDRLRRSASDARCASSRDPET